jgi:hypothetical protein
MDSPWVELMMIQYLIEHGVVVLDVSAGLVHPKNWDETTRAASEDASLACRVLGPSRRGEEGKQLFRH